MRVAIIGSRTVTIENLEVFLPPNTTEILSGGAIGVDTCAAIYAKTHGLPLCEYLPDYASFGKSAPLHRNIRIVEQADLVIAFWDGKSGGTRFTIEHCRSRKIPLKLYIIL